MSIKDNNSLKNQTIKERFVDKEVFGRISSLMETMIYTHVASKNILGVKSPLDK